MNQFTLEEKQTRTSAVRRIDGRFSDEAFGQAAALFGGLTQSRPVPESPRVPASYQPTLPSYEDDTGETIDGQADESTEEFVAEREVSTRVSSAGSPHHSSDNEIPSQYFRQRDDNTLIIKTPDFKGKTRKDQQQRFIVLYVWAYFDILGQPAPSKEHVLDASKASKVYDKNMSRYFDATDKEYLMHVGDGYELNPGGRDRLAFILEEMNDTSVVHGFEYWKASSKPGTKRATLSKSDEQEVQRWVEKAIDVGNLDVRNLGTATKYAMFALWAITKHLKVADAVKPKMAYLFLTDKFKTVSVKQRGFTDALHRSYNSDKFGKNASNLYFLTGSAEQEVEEWINRGESD